MISGLPTGFEARAAEDTVCYRIPADVVRPLLARPDVLRPSCPVYRDRPRPAPRTPDDPGQRRVAALIRRPPLLCPGSEPIRAAAQRMTAEGASAVLVRHGDTFGIVTDRDLRSRVIAAGLSPDEPVSAIMTEPAYTVSADRLAGDVMLDMLERNIHHIPVLSPAGEVLGVVDDGDLVAAEGRMPLLLRRAIGLAETQADLAAAAAGLNPALIALRDAQVPAEQVAAVRSVVLDALTRRLAELAVRDAGPPPVPFTWFALGSLARREAVPSSDVDSALAWAGDAPARRPAGGGRAAGYGRAGRGGERRTAGLRAAARRERRERGQPAVRPVAGVLAGRRAAPVRGPDPGEGADPGLADHRQPPGVQHRDAARRRAVAGASPDQPTPDLQRLLARFALSFRPPTGFWRDFVVEHSGERRGQLDLKHGGLIPIVDLARWAGMGAGMTSGSTMDRLRAAEAAGTLEGPEARTLMEAFGFIFSLRLDHQVEQLRRGEPPDDFIDPKQLNPLARSYLREAFRAVASVQAGLAAELSLGVRWG